VIWVKRVSLLIFLLLLLLVAGLAYVTMTNGGMQRIFSLSQSYLTEELTIGKVEGKLVGPGSFENINFKNAAGMEVEVSSVDYDWQPKNLFSRKLTVDRLDVDGVTVRLPKAAPSTAKGSSEPFQLKDLRIPFAVEAESFAVTNIDIYPPGADEPFVIDEMLLRAGGEEDELRLIELSVKAPQGSLRLGGNLNTSGDWPVALDSDWQFDHEQFGQFTGSGTVNGDLQSLKIQHEVEGFVNAAVDLDVTDVTGKLSWNGTVEASSDNLGIASEALNDIPFTLAAVTRGNLENYSASGRLTTDHEQTGPLQTDFNVTGDRRQIEFTDSTVQFEQSPTELAYRGTVELSTLEADLTIDWKELVYPLVDEPSLVLSPSGSLQFTGTAEDYNVKMKSQVQHELAGELSVVLAASGTPDKVTVNTLSIDGPPTSVYGVGVIDLATRAVDIKGNWKDFRWPLVGEEELIRSSKADFSVKGTLDDYQLDASMALSGKDIPAGDWQISTRGSTEKLSGMTLTGNVLDGQIDATGDVVFKPQVQWDLLLNTKGINPGLLLPEHEGSVSATVKTSGRITDNGPVLTADIQGLSGNYRGQALAGGGRVSFADGEIEADGMSVKVGSATIDLDGAIGDQLNLGWKMDADQISGLVPGVTGDIALQGRITGSRDTPKLEFELEAQDVAAGSLSSKSLNGSGIIDLTGNTESSIKITGTSLIAGGYQWQDVKIDGGGKPEAHQLTLSMTGDAPDIAIELKGGVKDELWSGELGKLDLLQTPVGDWKLHEPVAMDASRDSFATRILCLTNFPAVICADSKWDSKSGVLSRLALESFNSELFSDLMPPDITVDAPLSGTVDFTLKPGGKPNADARFDIPEGKIQFTSKGDVITAILGESEAVVLLEDDSVTSTVELALGEIGTVDAETVVTDLYGAQDLRGNIVSEIQDISLAGIGASQLQSIDGAFASELQLGGTLKAPRLVGGLGLQGFAAEIPSLSLKLEDGNITATSDGNGNLSIDGQIKSGDGELGISGFYNPESGDLEVQVKGDDFRVANAKRQKAAISPDLKMAINGETISVTGELGIPSAFIKTGGDSGVVVESPDVTIIESSDEKQEQEAEESDSRVALDVKVTLGDDVRVKAGPFDGALAGGLTLEQTPGKVPSGSGAIEVVSGDFLVYGQKLTMERGRVLFAGGPLDNPALELDVARDAPLYEVKAGVKVRGTAQAPTFELQSEPQQTDANTISYILFGKPVGTGVSYTLGKFITPDLYVSYGIGLFDRIQAFNMRYKVTDTVSLIGSSSTVSSADLIYTIER